MEKRYLAAMKNANCAIVVASLTARQTNGIELLTKYGFKQVDKPRRNPNSDGVLNYRSMRAKVYAARDRGEYAIENGLDHDRFAFDQIDVERCTRVQSIADKANASIVISSDWRLNDIAGIDKL
ncbi:hypothetical protein H671_21568, partial [Cricetulus griseus]